MNAFRRDLAILRGSSSWRRKLVLFAYIVLVLTVLGTADGVFVEQVAATEIMMLDLVMSGIAVGALIVARGFHVVPILTDVPPPSADEDRITAERAAWHRKFTTSA